MSKVERRANERYLSIIAALREIADDETADPKRRKIARALWKHRYPGVEQAGPLADLALTDADAVIAALGLVEERDANVIAFRYDDRAHHWETRRRYVTPWERIEDDA